MPVLGIEGQSVIRKFLIGSSQTFTAPFTGKAIVTCIGGGGQGAAGSGAADLGAGASFATATGGGAGGCAVSIVTLVNGTEYTVTVGAAGRHSTKILPQNNVGGGNGGNTSFAGSGVTTLTGNGGTGGTATQGALGSATQAGGAGGSASGGNIFNATGGAGGSITTTGSLTRYRGLATGGGAVGLLGLTGGRGGSITQNHSTNSQSLEFGTGGGGCGSNGGDINITSTNANINGASAGGLWYVDDEKPDQPSQRGQTDFEGGSTLYYWPQRPNASDEQGSYAGNVFGANAPLTFYGYGYKSTAEFLTQDTLQIGGYGASDNNAATRGGQAVGGNGGGGMACGAGGQGATANGVGGGGGMHTRWQNTSYGAIYNGTSRWGGGSGGITGYHNSNASYGDWLGGGIGVVVIEYISID